MELVQASSIFSRASGFIRRSGFKWTCNPYLGCPFGCSYCYAAFLPQNPLPPEKWGTWFRAKVNAVKLAQRDAPKVAGDSVYISSVTDPYIWAEQRLNLTCGILAALAPYQPSLMIQTRGPLVVRDIDLLSRFDRVRVQVSIPTDDDAVRKTFEPKAPRLKQRWAAVSELRNAGIPVSICISPMLPLTNPDSFAARLRDSGADRVSVVSFRCGPGRFQANTGKRAKLLLDEAYRWTDADYQHCLTVLRHHLSVSEEEEGFKPP